MLTAIVALGLQAQNTMSPYSKYGYGMLSDNASASQRAMGGVGYAMSSGRQINVMNPASYASIDSLTFLFDMGIAATTMWSYEGGNSGKDFGGGLDYLTMQFPLGKYMGASVGLLPFSSVGYSFGSEIEQGYDSRSGTGGINQLYAGVAGRPFKGFTVGMNISYLFGTTLNDTYAITNDGTTSLFERVVQVRDYRLQFGLQYNYPINRNNVVGVGLTYSPGKSLHGYTWGVYYDINSDTQPDTIGYTKMNDKYSLPDTWGFGVSYQYAQKLLIEADITYQPWAKAKYAALEYFEETKFDDRWKVALGLQFQPKSRGNYVQRINYRAGAFYTHDYLNIGGNNVREYGVTMGFGLPTPAARTLINLGFEWRRRQASPATLIKEDYFNITLGMNINELWFWQRKIN